jgi:hypothetical protein
VAVRGDLTGLLRSSAILAGLLVTVAGYLRGRLGGKMSSALWKAAS